MPSGLPVASQRVERAEQSCAAQPLPTKPRAGHPRAHSPEREGEPMSAFDGFVNFHPFFVHAPVVLIPTAAVMVSGIKLPPEKSVLKLKAGDDVS